MINEIEIKKILDEHEKRITTLESILISKRVPTISKGKKSLSDHIIDCRNKSFFSQAKTAEEVHEKIQQTYPCEFNRVAVCLLRLATRKELRKTTKVVNKKKYKAYVW